MRTDDEIKKYYGGGDIPRDINNVPAYPENVRKRDATFLELLLDIRGLLIAQEERFKDFIIYMREASPKS